MAEATLHFSARRLDLFHISYRSWLLAFSLPFGRKVKIASIAAFSVALRRHEPAMLEHR
jgi:hypothetical protein